MVPARNMDSAIERIPSLLERAKERGVSLRLSDEFSLLGPWEEALKGIGIEVLAPKKPARLIRIDAHGGIETLDTLKNGGTTGWKIPANVDEIDSLMENIVAS